MPLYITKKKTDYFSQTKKGGKANWIIERMFFLFSLRVYFCHQPRTLDLKSTVHQQATSEAAAKIRYFIYLTDD